MMRRLATTLFLAISAAGTGLAAEPIGFIEDFAPRQPVASATRWLRLAG